MNFSLRYQAKKLRITVIKICIRVQHHIKMCVCSSLISCHYIISLPGSLDRYKHILNQVYLFSSYVFVHLFLMCFISRYVQVFQCAFQVCRQKKNILLIMLTFTKQIKQQSTLGDNRYLLKLDFERPMTRLTGSACQKSWRLGNLEISRSSGLTSGSNLQSPGTD